MSNRKFYLFVGLLLAQFYFSKNLNAQRVFEGQEIQFKSAALSKQFTEFIVASLDANAIGDFVRSENSHAQFDLKIGRQVWSFDFHPSPVVGKNYQLRISSDAGVEINSGAGDLLALQGREQSGGGAAGLVLNQNYLSGSFQKDGEWWFVEPLSALEKGAAADLFVIYQLKNVILTEEAGCMAVSADAFRQKHEEDLHAAEQEVLEKQMACYNLELAIASDKSMFNKYGSVLAVQNHNITVINNVQTNYTGVFVHDIEFVIVQNFVVTTTDPWTNSTDAGTLLDDFTDWGNPPTNGFGTTDFDLAELWTNRDFNGGTVGIAWLDGLCNGFKYHCLQDFTTNAALLRCTAAHEIGHNLDAVHDNCPPGNFIMCPTVSASNTWSALSISDINGTILTNIGPPCLEACAGNDPVDADFSWSPNPACKMQPVQFTDQSTGPVTSWNWTFPGGTPATSTQQNPTVTWANAGSYNVVLSVNGGASSLVQTVIVLPLPVANFTYTVDGQTITTNNTSTNADSYLWNFGDGNTSTDFEPEHTYDNAGAYTVTLTAFNSCGSNTKTLQVITAPTAAFTANPTSGCAPLTVHFFEQCSPDAINFQWSFPGGTPAFSSQPNPTVVYNSPGFYEVTLIATNAAGLSTTVFQDNFINVLPFPVAQFAWTANGLTVNFDNQSQNANTYLWNFGDGTSSTQFEPTHTYADAGDYDITLTVTGTCGTSVYNDFITIILPPTAAFTIVPSSGCAPLTVQYTNQSSGNPTNFQWQFPGGIPATSTQPNPTVVYNTAGSFGAILTASNAAGTNTTSQQNIILVSTAPSPSFTSQTTGSSVAFTNSTTGNPTSFSWDFGDGQTSNFENPTHTYSAEGTFTVILTATNACGSVQTLQDVTIALPPIANFTFTPNPAFGCSPMIVQFTNASSGGAVNNFQWSFPGGTPSSSTAANPSVVYNSQGVFSASLTVSNTAGSNTISQNDIITVGLGPLANFSAATNGFVANFTNNSAGATTFLWNFGDNQTSTDPNPTHTYGADGSYTVLLTATNVCGSTNFSQTVVITTPPTANFTFTPASGCAPLTVQFTSTSSTNSQNFEWTFAGGSPATSNLPNPTVVFAAAGTYSASLTVSNSAGQNTSSQSNIISVNAAPSANFAAATNGLTALFSNSSSGATTYFWDFGDGQNSTASDPSHTYATDGNYTVNLTATNICGSTVFSQIVSLNTPPVAGFTFSPASGCSPLTVQYTSTSSANTQNLLWDFPGGSPATSTLPNPTVVYSTAGTYSASLTATNATGQNSTTQTDIILVSTVPATNFSTSVNGATASFSNSSSGATTYSWDFGDGSTSSEMNPTYTFSSDGDFTVILTSTNACGSTTVSQNVSITTPPTANFTYSPASGCAPLTVQFASTSSTNAQNFEWAFDGGTPATSNLPNPTVVFAAAGTYSASLTVSNSAGQNTAFQQNIIVVSTAPTANFSISVNGSTASFSNSSSGATSYFWDFGDGFASFEENPTYTFANDGNYTVLLTATNACGSTMFSQNVEITTPPTAGFIADPTSGCAPLTVQFTSTSTVNSQNFEWSFPGGTPATSTEQNPTVVFNTPGAFSASLTVSNAAGQSTITPPNFIFINDVPTANFTFALGGLAANFSNNSLNANAFLWNFGDGTTSTDPNPTHEYAAAGNFTVTLQALNECGAVQFSQNLEITGTAPFPQFASDVREGCAPFAVQFNDQSVGDPTAWKWTFAGGSPASSTEQNPSVTYSTAGTYEVILTVTNAYGSNTATIPNYVQVNTTPTVGFKWTSNLGQVNFENLSNGATTYSWNFGDGATSSEANPTHSYTQNGTYTVTLQAINACGASVLQQSVVVIVIGTSTPSWVADFNLFPNPTADFFTVQMSASPAQSVDFQLFNSLGQQVRQISAAFSSGQISQKFDLLDLPAGAYSLRISVGNAAFFVKVVKS